MRKGAIYAHCTSGRTSNFDKYSSVVWHVHESYQYSVLYT